MKNKTQSFESLQFLQTKIYFYRTHSVVLFLSNPYIQQRTLPIHISSIISSITTDMLLTNFPPSNTISTFHGTIKFEACNFLLKNVTNFCY